MKKIEKLTNSEIKIAKEYISNLTNLSFIAEQWYDDCHSKSRNPEYTRIFLSHPKLSVNDPRNLLDEIGEFIKFYRESTIINITEIDLDKLKEYIENKSNKNHSFNT